MSGTTWRDDAPVLASTARALQHRLARAQVEGRATSVVAGVVRDGALVWSGGWGDVPGPVTDVQHRIGSITKTLTAVTVLQAVRDGLVDLDAAVASVVEELDASAYGARSLRQLLSHTGGLQSEPAGPWWERTPGVDLPALVSANPGDAAAFPPGQQFHYTNLGYAFLGAAVARLRGLDWWEVVRTGVLEPLGMTRTTYLPEQPAARGTSVHPGTGEAVAEPATDTGAMAPAGQAWSTVADLGRFAAFLVAGDDRVLSGDWLDLASHPVGGSRGARLRSAHGLGLQLVAGGSGVLRGHTGSMPGFQAGCFVDPERRTGAVVLASSTTGTPGGPVGADLLALLHEHEPTLPRPWVPATAVPDVVREVVGTWHWGNTPVVLTWEGDALVARVRGAEAYWFGLRPGSREELVGTGGYHDGEPVVVHRDPEGAVTHLEVATFVYTRTPYDPAVPPPGGLPEPLSEALPGDPAEA